MWNEGRADELEFTEADLNYSKVLRNDEFGYWTITVDRPLLDEDGNPIVDRKSKPKPDAKKRDTENIPFTYGGSTAGSASKTEVIQAYFDAEVKPHVPDAWIDWSKVKIGYEIPPSKTAVRPAACPRRPHPSGFGPRPDRRGGGRCGRPTSIA